MQWMSWGANKEPPFSIKPIKSALNQPPSLIHTWIRHRMMRSLQREGNPLILANGMCGTVDWSTGYEISLSTKNQARQRKKSYFTDGWFYERLAEELVWKVSEISVWSIVWIYGHEIRSMILYVKVDECRGVRFELRWLISFLRCQNPGRPCLRSDFKILVTCSYVPAPKGSERNKNGNYIARKC